MAFDDLRARVGMVTQDVQLFGASVRDNIALFDPAVTDEQIRAALAGLDLLEWVQRLGGLEAELAAGGGGLSAGEAQLLAFARVLLRDPALVILDEAASRLDPATEARLERAIDRLLAGRTAIVIAHRLHTVGRAVYGEGTKAARQWAERNVGRLSAGDWKALLCSLKALRPRTAEGRDAVRLAIGYFATNRQRMDYPAYRARGLHIGSGVVEAACKCVVATRCKRTGMRWSQPGAQAILTLRTLLLNERWDEYWQPLKAAA